MSGTKRERFAHDSTGAENYQIRKCGLEQLAGKVGEYLTLCEQRDFEKAQAFLGPQAILVFPGGKQYTRLEDMAQAATGAYRWVRKNKDEFTYFDRNDQSIVVSSGTLYGETLSGDPFSGIRYQDWFTFEKGLIVKQEVWNDLAACGIFSASKSQLSNGIH